MLTLVSAIAPNAAQCQGKTKERVVKRCVATRDQYHALLYLRTTPCVTHYGEQCYVRLAGSVSIIISFKSSPTAQSLRHQIRSHKC